MHKQLIQDIMMEIAQEEIPDDMQVFDAIANEIQKTTPRRVVRMTRYGWVAAVLVVSLMFSAVALAVYQGGGETYTPHQDGILPEYKTQIKESVTVEDVTITLNWVYADEQDIVVEYQIEADRINFMPVVNLTRTDNGQSFTQEYGIGSGGGPAGPLVSSATFSAETITDSPSELSLNLSIQLNEYVTSEMGFYVDDDGTVRNDRGEDISDEVEVITVGHFAYDFTVPFYQWTVIEVGETQSINNMAVELRRVEYTSAFVRAVLCFDSSTDELWVPDASLHVNGEMIDGFGDSSLEAGCSVAIFPYAYSAGDLSITVDRLGTLPDQSDQARVREAFGNVGLEVEFDENGQWYVVNVPDELAETHPFLISEALQNLRNFVDGPWTYDVAMEQ